MIKSKFIKSVVLSLSLIFNNVFPVNTPNLVTETNFGNLIIYFNSNINGKLVYDNNLGYYVNVSSSTVYGYTIIDNVQYQVYFPTLDQPYYRSSSYQSTYYYFTSMSKGTLNNMLLYDKSSTDYRYITCVCLITTFAIFGCLKLGR